MMIRFLSFIFCVGVFLIGTPPPAAADEMDMLDKGVKAGHEIPIAISLPDQTGRPKTLAELTGDKGVILMFNRSSSWCGYCIRQMIAWSAAADKFEKLGYNVAALTYDPVTQQKTFARKHNIAYPVLSDQGSQVIQAFGLLNEDYENDSAYYGIPHPAIYVISPDGLITHRFAEPSYQVRPDIELVYQSLLTDAPAAPVSAKE